MKILVLLIFFSFNLYSQESLCTGGYKNVYTIQHAQEIGDKLAGLFFENYDPQTSGCDALDYKVPQKIQNIVDGCEHHSIDYDVYQQSLLERFADHYFVYHRFKKQCLDSFSYNSSDLDRIKDDLYKAERKYNYGH